jgi:hypothetical protein
MELLTMLATILPEPPNGTAAEMAEHGIDFFSLWIARIGGVVAFIGAIKFALGIKSDETTEKIHGLMVMVSGFMIISAVNDLDIFTAAGGAGANAEFEAIMDFIARWASWLGAAVTFLGAIMFGFAVREDDAGKKLLATYSFVAGAVVIAVSQSLNLFV